MPGGDRTGPGGMGPMTGRAAGYCAGYNAPGFANPAGGRGFGGGFGWGRGRGGGGGGWGWRNRFYATGLTGWQRAGAGWSVPLNPVASTATGPYGPPTREQELAAMREQAEQFETALAGIRRRIDQLEAEPNQDS